MMTNEDILIHKRLNWGMWDQERQVESVRYPRYSHARAMTAHRTKNMPGRRFPEIMFIGWEDVIK